MFEKPKGKAKAPANQPIQQDLVVLIYLSSGFLSIAQVQRACDEDWHQQLLSQSRSSSHSTARHALRILSF
jgi:hypothetical protein